MVLWRQPDFTLYLTPGPVRHKKPCHSLLNTISTGVTLILKEILIKPPREGATQLTSQNGKIAALRWSRQDFPNIQGQYSLDKKGNNILA